MHFESGREAWVRIRGSRRRCLLLNSLVCLRDLEVILRPLQEALLMSESQKANLYHVSDESIAIACVD